jgi:diaminopimelate epimerase
MGRSLKSGSVKGQIPAVCPGTQHKMANVHRNSICQERLERIRASTPSGGWNVISDYLWRVLSEDKSNTFYLLVKGVSHNDVIMMLFHKYTAIGNDYLVLDARHYPLPAKDVVVRVCDRHFGIGSDGLLFGASEQNGCFPLKIFNPDGSEAEKSGNGIRIFAHFLWEVGYGKTSPLTVNVPSGKVSCFRGEGNSGITTAMGIPRWDSSQLPSPCDQQIMLDGCSVEIHAVSMGNPHAVICLPSANREDILRYGPLLECHPLFPEKTNVQIIHVRNPQHIDMQIWERGVGYTFASGSSACAAFAVAHKLGLCDTRVTVHMPGGDLQVWQEADGCICQSGKAIHIADCQYFLSREDK